MKRELLIQLTESGFIESPDSCHISQVSGGDTSMAYRIDEKEHSYFLKYNNETPADFFKSEAKGLSLLNEAGEFSVPECLYYDKSFLLLEWIDQGPKKEGFWSDFGRRLAQMHRNTWPKFGLNNDNYIGSLNQSNTNHVEWPSFFVYERLIPLLKLASQQGKLSASYLSKLELMEDRLKELIPKAAPALLHGDLWSGNYLSDANGEPILIDPAVYYGHPEVDLAFMKMFGGFPEELFLAYSEVSPIEQDFEKRVPIFNLYPGLVHLVLFGTAYLNSVEPGLKILCQ